MNIFILHTQPRLCAEYHCDKHVIKMVVETAQMLSTAHHILNSPFKDKLYKATHINHPCNKWVRKSKGNYIWALELLAHLLHQYKIRYHKIHKTCSIYKYLCQYPKFNQTNMTEFALAMPQEYIGDNIFQSYRQYYLGDKKRFAKWERGVDRPWWWK